MKATIGVKSCGREGGGGKIRYKSCVRGQRGKIRRISCRIGEKGVKIRYVLCNREEGGRDSTCGIEVGGKVEQHGVEM